MSTQELWYDQIEQLADPPSQSLAYLMTFDGSITQYAQQHYGNIDLEFVSGSWQQADTESAGLLNLLPENQVFVREVYIRQQKNRWWHGLTLFPEHTTQGMGESFLQLGQKPLGHLLYAHGALLSCRLRQYRQIDDYYARRSLFYFADRALLVTETFLPQMVKDLTLK